MLTDALSLVDEDLQAELKEVEALPEYENQSRTKNILAALAAHSKKHRRLGIQAVRDSNGDPIFEKAAADRELNTFWGQRFQEAQVDEPGGKALAEQYSNPLPSTEWVMPSLIFYIFVMRVEKTSPGPDGVPFAAWASNITRCLKQ